MSADTLYDDIKQARQTITSLKRLRKELRTTEHVDRAIADLMQYLTKMVTLWKSEKSEALELESADLLGDMGDD